MNQRRSSDEKIAKILAGERLPILASLMGRLKDITLAEDVVQDAMIKAWETWTLNNLPKNPRAWLYQVAYNRAIDIIRRDKRKQQVYSATKESIDSHTVNSSHVFHDDRLKLIFCCCHPSLKDDLQVALTLNVVCGLPVSDIADIFLLKTTTLAQRLIRAKRKIKLSGIPYQVPTDENLPPRLHNVLGVIYFIFNVGYYAKEKSNLIDLDHLEEAQYLAGLLNQLLPMQAETMGLISLMYFHQSRIPARLTHKAEYISLQQQDRSLWNDVYITEADKWFEQAMSCKNMGPFQIQAAISGVHSKAKSWEQTDWQQIKTLYQKLYNHKPTDTVKLNWAVSMAFAGEPQKAHELMGTLNEKRLQNYLPFYLAKAQVASQMSNKSMAVNNFSLAMALAKHPQEQRFIQKQIDLINQH
jgi:RNA polymerase sigma-70 factor (ECF subfamily)